MKLFVTNHAVDRFKERVSQIKTREAKRVLMAMFDDGADWGPKNKDIFYKLCKYKRSGESFVLPCATDGKRAIIKTVLSIKQAENMLRLMPEKDIWDMALESA